MSYEPVPNEDPDHDHNIDHDDDDDEEEVNATQPFQPDASSTPYTPGAAYHPGEAHEMTNLPEEQSGSGGTVPEAPEYAELVNKPTLIQKAKEKLTASFPKVDWSKIVVGLGGRKGNVGKAVAIGRKGGETLIFKQDDTLTQAFQRQYGSYLGPPKEPGIIVEDREGLAETNQRLKEAQQQEQSFNAAVEKQQQALQERQVKENELEQINQRIANFENEGGTVLERQNETDRLKRQAAKLERDIKVAKDAEKQYARAIKERDKAARDVERLQRQHDAQQQNLATKQARLARTKQLEELNEEREITQTQNRGRQTYYE